MKKPSLAIDLAKQASAAAMAEVQAAEAAFQPSSTRWQPATLPQGFALAPALQRAVQEVAGHLGQWLQHEGLAVTTSAGAIPTPAANLPHTAARTGAVAQAVQVQEQISGRLVRGYSESAVLGLFASQQQRNGVVIDGQV